MRTGKINWRNEKGAVGVIVAIVIVVLLMVMALVVDVGQGYLLRRQLQTVADAASLAAAIDLAKGYSQSTATETAQNYAQRNTTRSFDSLDVTFPSASSVRVVARQSQPTFFAVLFGRSSFQVAASATASTELATTVEDGIVPIIVPFQLIEGHVGSSNTATFNLASEGDDPRQGFFWLVNLGGGGAGTPEYAEWIEHGYPNPVSVGDFASGDGIKAALKDALEERMETNPKMIVPLYDSTEASGGAKDYHVAGFAEFVITDFNLTGNPKTISGYFTTGDVVTGFSGGQQGEDHGIDDVRLTQ